jgi:hypothetical protein
MIFKVEYLGKMFFIFQTSVGYGSGDQVGALLIKNTRGHKSHAGVI